MPSRIATVPEPIEPMLAKVAPALPDTPGFLFEPKWDGFRAIVFRTADATQIQSRDLKSLNRYFPELVQGLHDALPPGTIVDGEIVVLGKDGLDFDALQQRVHPAASRVARLSEETPARFVAFDLLCESGASTLEWPQTKRRAQLEKLLADATPPLHLTPMTQDYGTAVRWLRDFEGAGLDGVMAKPASAAYQPGKRAMLKIKHVRSADCVVAGYRLFKERDDAVGSLLLGLYSDDGVLQHVGITSAFDMASRVQLLVDLAPLRKLKGGRHPWIPDKSMAAPPGQRVPGARSRWSGTKDLGWEPLRPERVCEVRYDHLQGDRFRHATTFLRWRPDKPPEDCRYDQLEQTAPFELSKVFAA